MPANLRRLLRRRRPEFSVVSNLLRALNVQLVISDAGNNTLVGNPDGQQSSKTPIFVEDELAGWISGPPAQSQAVAGLLQRLLILEAEKEALSDELLDSYRELTVLYNLSEHLLAKPEPQAIAATTLQEISTIFRLSAAWILLREEGSGALRPLSRAGQQLHLRGDIGDNEFVAAVINGSEAEIRNGLAAATIMESEFADEVALLCAPLRTEQRVLGCILLVNEMPSEFRARDLKMVNAIALQAGPAIEMARLYQIALVQGRMQQELEMAYQVQASLIPDSLPAMAGSGWEFAGQWLPARELSGDYYDFIPHGSHQYGLVIADVADKGLASALFMVNTRSAVRTAVDQTHSPAAAISKANRLISQEATDGLFVSMFYALLDSESGAVTYVNAGHNPALYYDAASQRLVELRHTGIPIGILQDAEYAEEQIQLRPGDLLVLYTDGVTEAMNQSLEEFGLQRLQSVILAGVHEPAEALARSIAEAVNQFTDSTALSDDLTVMVTRRTG